MLSPLKYSLSIEVRPYEGVIDAVAKVKVINSGKEPTAKLLALLNKGLRVSEVDARGACVKSFKQYVASVAGVEGLRVNVVEVTLEEPLTPGDEAVIEVRYEGAVTGYEDVFPYVKDRVSAEYALVRPDAFSYPVLGPPDFRALVSTLPRQRFDYEVVVTVPKGFVAANVGGLKGVKERNEHITYVFRSKLPSWRVDVAVSRFAVVEDGALDIRVYSLPEDIGHARRILEEVPGCLKLYRDLLGDPPAWVGYTIIEIPEGWGGQADMAGALIPADSFRNPKEINGVYHELAHLWNPLSGEEAPSRFLDEGIASYLQLIAEDKLLGVRLEDRLGDARRMLKELAKRRPDLLNTPVSEYGKAGLTDASYAAGPIILHNLREALGDERFWAAMKSFIRRFRNHPATLEDFVNTFAETCGEDARKLLKEWLFSTAPIKELIDEGTTSSR